MYSISDSPSIAIEIFPQHLTAVFIIMTVYTEVLPVGTVGGIVSRVPVLMVDRKGVFVFVVKLPGAFGADEAV